MTPKTLSVRALQHSDIPAITDYWLTAEPAFLTGMGVDLSKMPTREQWEAALTRQLETPLREQSSFTTIWETDGQAIGHCNINNIRFGEEAFMHLHLWRSDLRQQGAGVSLVRMSLKLFFDFFELKRVFCEPSAYNPAPNKTLPKVGFTFVKAHLTTPSWLTSEQLVHRWEMSREYFLAHIKNA